MRTLSSLVVCAATLVLTGGCDSVARSMGAFPVVQYVPPGQFDEKSFLLRNPQHELLWIQPLNAHGVPQQEKVPLVRLAFYHPSFDRIGDTGIDELPGKRSYYRVVDVGTLSLHPGLGQTDDAKKKEVRNLIADMLLSTADWNGEVYWRRFVAAMTVYESAKATSTAALGAGIAATFISPVLGASLTGAGLAIDTAVGEFTSDFNVEIYGELRDAAAAYRNAKREVIKKKLAATDSYAKYTVFDCIQDVDEYAFSYSLRGAAHAVKKQGQLLQSMMAQNGNSANSSADIQSQLAQ